MMTSCNHKFVFGVCHLCGLPIELVPEIGGARPSMEKIIAFALRLACARLEPMGFIVQVQSISFGRIEMIASFRFQKSRIDPVFNYQTAFPIDREIQLLRDPTSIISLMRHWCVRTLLELSDALEKFQLEHLR